MSYCGGCGTKLETNQKFCPKCGKPIEYNQQQAKVNIVNSTTANINVKNYKGKWSTGKLVIAIISMVLFFVISLQSCAAGVSNALKNNDATSGSSGFLCGLLILIGGIVTVSTRNSKEKAGSIVAIILYWLAAIATLDTGDTYPDLPIWGSVAFAFGLVNLGSAILENPKYKEPKKEKGILIAVVAVSIVVFLFGVASGTSEIDESKVKKDTKKQVTDFEKVDNVSEEKSDATINEESKTSYGLGDTFIFDELEITVGSTVSFGKITNKYSDYKGKTVIKIPVTIKNLKDETHQLNYFYCKTFGSKGIELERIGHYFDDSIEDAKQLRSGASYNKNFYLLYDGDGTYAIEFDKWSKNKITLEFEIKK